MGCWLKHDLQGGIFVGSLDAPAADSTEAALIDLLSRQQLDEVKSYSTNLR